MGMNAMIIMTRSRLFRTLITLLSIFWRSDMLALLALLEEEVWLFQSLEENPPKKHAEI